MTTYPEHEKLMRVSEKSQAVGEFLEWLRNEKQVLLMKYNDHLEDYFMYPMGINDLLAQFFNIDQNKLEEEKRERC